MENTSDKLFPGIFWSWRTLKITFYWDSDELHIMYSLWKMSWINALCAVVPEFKMKCVWNLPDFLVFYLLVRSHNLRWLQTNLWNYKLYFFWKYEEQTGSPEHAWLVEMDELSQWCLPAQFWFFYLLVTCTVMKELISLLLHLYM